MNDELREIIDNTEGIEVSDEIAISCPRVVFMKWGDAAYQDLLDLMVGTNCEQTISKSKVLLERMPYYSDGPSSEFVKRVSSLLDHKTIPLRIIHSCLRSCISQSPIWRNSIIHCEIEELLLKTLAEVDLQHEKLLERGIQAWLTVNLLRKKTILDANKGLIEVPEFVVNELLKEDERYQHLLSLGRVSHQEIVNMLIISKTIPSLRDDNVFSYELISTPSTDFPLTKEPVRKLIEISWRQYGNITTCEKVTYE